MIGTIIGRLWNESKLQLQMCTAQWGKKSAKAHNDKSLKGDRATMTNRDTVLGGNTCGTLISHEMHDTQVRKTNRAHTPFFF